MFQHISNGCKVDSCHTHVSQCMVKEKSIFIAGPYTAPCKGGFYLTLVTYHAPYMLHGLLYSHAVSDLSLDYTH